MSDKKRMSAGAVKTLTGIGIAFGTVIVFFISFFLAFNFIINPITPISVGAADAEAENEELRTQVKTLEDEVELLNTTIEKYRTAASAPKEEYVEDEPQQTQSGNVINSEKDKPEQSKKPEKAEPFEPETVVTPEGGEGMNEPADEPITIIDISE